MAKLYRSDLEIGTETDRLVGDAMVDLCEWVRLEPCDDVFLYLWSGDDLPVYKDDRRCCPAQPFNHWAPSSRLKDAWVVVRELVSKKVVDWVELHLGEDDVRASVRRLDMEWDDDAWADLYQEALAICRVVLLVHDVIVEGGVKCG